MQGRASFPATIVIDDPFVADELSLPTVSNQKTSTDPSVVQTDISGELSKRITSEFGLSIGYAWTHLDQSGPPHNPNGFQNLEITPKYQFLLNAPHEAVASVGVATEVGNTGAPRVGALPFATYTPTFYFGKGAGDLPESLNWARPFALTGTVGYSITSSKKTTSPVIDPDSGMISLAVDHASNTINYGFAVEYSNFYLRANIHDFGLPGMGEPADAAGRVQLRHPGDRPLWREDRRHDQPGSHLVRAVDAVRCRGDHPGNQSHREECRDHRSAALLSRRYLSQYDRPAVGRLLNCAVCSSLSLAMVAVGPLPVAALCHAFLDEASPPVGGTVPASPKEVRLTFSEAIEPHFSGIDLATGDGQAIATGPAVVDPGDDKQLVLGCRHLFPAVTGCAGMLCRSTRTAPRASTAFAVER